MNARRAGVLQFPSPCIARALAGVFALVVAGNLPVAAIAADWTRVEASGTDQHAYDRSMIAIRGDEITYWRRVTFAKPVRVRTGMAKSAIYQERIHCRDHTVRTLAWQVFADEGVTLESSSNADADAAAIVPETVGDRFGSVMCPFVEARRRRDADLARDEAQLSARRKDLEQLKLEVDQLEASVLRLRIEAAQSQPAPIAATGGAAVDPPAVPVAPPAATPGAEPR
jgi:hypothetical protein